MTLPIVAIPEKLTEQPQEEAELGQLPNKQFYRNPPDRGLVGIHGWLIIPAIGLVLGLIINLFESGREAKLYLAVKRLQRMYEREPTRDLTDTDAFRTVDNYLHRRAELAIRGRSLGAFPDLGQIEQTKALLAMFVLFHFSVVVLFFTKSRFAPGAIIILLSIALGLSIVGRDCTKIAGALVQGAVWGPYFMLSKRVKATFVR